MTQQEYETAKSKCVTDFCEEHGYIQSPDLREIINYAFDRAYVLGKEVGQKGEPLNTYLTDEDKENVRAEYKVMVKAFESPRNDGEKEYAKGFMEALEWLFGIRFLTNQQNDNE